MNKMGSLILLQVVLIALNAVFACAEIAVLSINENKLERMAEQGNRKAVRLSKLTKEPARFLATIQVAITLSGFLGSAFAAENFSEPLVDWLIALGVGIPRATLDTAAVILITLILSYFTLVFGELVPKRVAMKKSEQLALGISGLVYAISVAFKPIVWMLSASTNSILRLMRIDPNELEEPVSEEEIRMMVDVGSEKGSIDEREKEMIQNVFEFDDLNAGEIATHRTDVVALSTEDSMEEWAKIIHESRFSMYPVCGESVDDVEGVLNARDYYRLEDRSREQVMKIVRPAYFVPETIKADVLFRDMKKTKNSMAIALDEYGGIVGIVTLNDLIECLVGDLGMEENPGQEIEPHLEKLDENTWAVVGNVGLDEIRRELKVKIGGEDAETFTGFVFDKLGMVPGDGEQKLEFRHEALRIEINRVEEHQIVDARIIKEDNRREESAG